MRLSTWVTGCKTGLQTTWVLSKVIFPITLLVTIISFTPIMDWIVILCTPLMSLVGLSGEAAIPFVLANVLNLYAGIGAMLTMELTVKEAFILAMMISFSHNLFVETAVAVKIGLRASIVVAIRVGLAITTGLLIHLFWQGGDQVAQYGFIPASDKSEIIGWTAILLHGFETAAIGIIQLAIIVIPLMIGIQIMKDLKFLEVFSRWMNPFTRLLGISRNTSTTLGAGLLFGLAYGAGVIIQEAKEGKISKKDMYLLFIFLIACHAVIEDTLLFIPLGIPVWPLLIFRLFLAIVVTIAIAYMWGKVDLVKQNQELKKQKMVNKYNEL